MPLIIKELVIKATVGEGSGGQQAPASSTPASEEAIVASCVEQVLQILKDKEER
ncbi:MAG: hypothetical protein KDC66_13910 [Phaeodactylibacter sp.]|nr:hypothetical protein [Phaeodactylibacter sp.]MCB9274942.1 hypothetical protein [Lewinellaceae bacterium]